ncbi:MAG: energy-coupling factor ABC transporter ATP-binding protein [Methanomassiliicoccales archaeon]|nr:energy-coupling factor ABC transporter ATP-binding protein [Methanomassiliicoccales archaeon]
MDALKLINVSYTYADGVRALENVSLTISEGERVAIVGPNGAGKSTLLRILAGLYFPSTGNVEIMGTTLSRKDAERLRKNIGFLFQDPDDQIFMPTVWDDVAFGPINLGLPEDEVKKRVREAIRMAGIEGYEERVPHHLSFGEKKRVAIAGVLAMEAPILLLDEPTANLDPQGRRDLVNILDSVSQTVVLATHDLSVAFELTNRAIVLKKSVIFDGKPSELVERPDVLASANLELPSMLRLMDRWRRTSDRKFHLPLTIDEALRIINEECRKNGI